MTEGICGKAQSPTHTGRAPYVVRPSHAARSSRMGLSVAATGFATAGYLPPVAGALLQEAIDLAVIINALRALRG